MTKYISIFTNKKIRIEFNYPFDWGFVYACREENIQWDGSVRYLSFGFAYLPNKAETLILNYPKVFSFYPKETVELFSKDLQRVIDRVFKKTIVKKVNVDFTKYPDLFDHQKKGIEFLLSKDSCILADEPGLGKTLQACIFTLEKNCKSVLIITPLSARYVWKNELTEWLGIEEKDIIVIEKEKPENLQLKKFNIINYDKLKKYLNQLIKAKYDIIILDEAHLIKNNSSKRFKYTYKISKRTENVICLTGTPLLNRPIELFPLLKIINHPLGKSITDFGNRYCDRKLVSYGTRSHWENKGCSNSKESSEKLKSVMIMRLSKDCLDLPEKIYTVYKIDFSYN